MKQTKKWINRGISLIIALALVLVGTMTFRVDAKAASSNLYEAKDAFVLPKGLHVILDSTKDTMAASNNYSISFDLNNANAGLSIMLYNLADGSDCTRVYIGTDGSPMIQVAYAGYSEWYGLYRGAGTEAGVLVDAAVEVPADGTVHIKVIHEDGVLTLKVNDVIYMTTAISALNAKVTEGSITKIGLECESENAATVSNLVVSEYPPVEEEELPAGSILLPQGLYVLLDSAKDTMAASNNYIISFDINNANAGLGIILYNLADGSDCTRVYIGKDGSPMIQAAYAGYSEWYGLYRGAGEETGVLVDAPVVVPESGKVHIEVTHVDGVLTLKVDGVVYMTTAISALNEKVSEGVITKIGLECETADAAVVSNVKVSEYAPAQDDVPATGDMTPVALLVAVMLASAAAIALTAKKRYC